MISRTPKKNRSPFRDLPEGEVFSTGNQYFIKSGPNLVLPGSIPQRSPGQSVFGPTNLSVVEIGNESGFSSGLVPFLWTFSSTPGEATLFDAVTPAVEP